MITIGKKMDMTCDQILRCCRVGRQRGKDSLCQLASNSQSSLTPLPLPLLAHIPEAAVLLNLLSGLPQVDKLAIRIFLSMWGIALIT